MNNVYCLMPFACLEFKIAWCSHRKVLCHYNSILTVDGTVLLGRTYKWFPAQLFCEEWC